jgi:hypothetical protein
MTTFIINLISKPMFEWEAQKVNQYGKMKNLVVTN